MIYIYLLRLLCNIYYDAHIYIYHNILIYMHTHNLFVNLLMIIPTLQKNTITETIISNLTLVC